MAFYFSNLILQTATQDYGLDFFWRSVAYSIKMFLLLKLKNELK